VVLNTKDSATEVREQHLEQATYRDLGSATTLGRYTEI